jgi:hypothetical protein
MYVKSNNNKMLKTILCLILIEATILSILSLEDRIKVLNEKIFIKEVETFFIDKNKRQLDKKEFLELLVDFYTLSDLNTLETIEKIYLKINDFDEYKDENIYVKNKAWEFIDSYFEEEYDLAFVKDIVKNKKFLFFLERHFLEDKIKFLEKFYYENSSEL